MSFNPNTPDTLGLEWFPTVEAGVAVGGGAVACVVLDATITEDLDQLWLFLQAVAGSGGYELEVYDLTAGAAPGTLHNSIYRPSEDATVGQFTAAADVFGSLTTVNMWDFIDEAVLVPGTYTPPGGGGILIHNESWIAPAFGRPGSYTARFAGIVGTLASRLITAVTLNGRASSYTSYGLPQVMTIQPFLLIGGTPYPGPAITLNGSAPHPIEATWPVNPATGRGWKIGDVENFAGGTGTDSAGWTWSPTGSSNNLPALLQGYLTVQWATVDPRVAVAGSNAPHAGWNRWELTNPITGAVGWHKIAGHRYVMILRQCIGSGQIQPRYLDSGDAGHNGYSSAVPVLLASRRFGNELTAEDLSPTFAVVLEQPGAVVSPESQPYASIDNDLTPQGLDDWTSVYAGHEVVQHYTAAEPAGAEYAFVRALVRQQAPDAPDPLTVTLHLAADDSQLGDPVDITSDMLNAPRTGWTLVEFRIPSVGVISDGVQVYLKFDTVADLPAGWAVQVASAVPNYPDPGDPPADITAALVGTTVDCYGLGVDSECAVTVAATLATIPDPPTDLTAVSVASDIVGCEHFARLAWTATALGATFGRYDVERSDDGGLTWFPIARIWQEDIDSVDDHEQLKNVETFYRVRVRRADHAFSDWIGASVTVTMTCCGGLLFTSNLAATLGRWWNVKGPITKFHPPRQYVEREMYNRRGAVVFRGIEAPLDRFARTLILAGDPQLPAEVIGRAEFHTLEALADADLPYVCIADEDGNRWFAALELTGDLTRQEKGGLYTADVTIRETTNVPYIIDLGD